MKAAVLHAFGEPPRYEDFPAPVPAADEHLVRVRAAAVKHADRVTSTGLSHPLTPKSLPNVCGLDGMGVLPDGTRVLFMFSRAPYGGMAEETVVKKEMCIPLPDALDDVQAAAIFNPAMSAWFAVTWRGQLTPGQSVLVLGATGAAGSLAVQVAKSVGAGRIVAAGRNEARLAALGVETINLAADAATLEQRFFDCAGKTGFDVVIDYVWGPPIEALIAAMRRPGYPVRRVRIVNVGSMAGFKISLDAAIGNYGIEIMGSGAGDPAPPEVGRAGIREIVARAARGELTVPTETLPLANVAEAWRRSDSERRLVLVP